MEHDVELISYGRNRNIVISLTSLFNYLCERDKMIHGRTGGQCADKFYPYGVSARTTGLHSSEQTATAVRPCRGAVYTVQVPQVTDCTVRLFNMTGIRIGKHKFRE
jgi:hypothetical protein